MSLLFTALFFYEYLPPVSRVQIPFDLGGYHYPLTNYAFRALAGGRIPQWDPTIYCGMSYTGNVQSALFYPPAWLLFAANIARDHLSFLSLEMFVILHVWLAFLLCYWWLDRRGLILFASLSGGAIFAFGGYMMSQLQHLGVAGGYAWMPLGMLGIDELDGGRRWSPLWKIVAASALCFLAGYTPTWFVFAVAMMVYAAARPRGWKIAAGTAAALGASLLVSSVQLLPSLELSGMRAPEARYGTGLRDSKFFLSYFIPNFFDFGLDVAPETNPGYDYLYLGATAIVGLLCLVVYWRRNSGALRVTPLIAVFAISGVIVTNPFGIVWAIIRHSAVLAQVCRDWYFLAGLALAIAPLAAIGLDRFLRHPARARRRWLAAVTMTALAVAVVVELKIWRSEKWGFQSGWDDAVQTLSAVAVFGLGLYVLRTQAGAVRAALLPMLLLATGVDYKVNGTSKRFNATTTKSEWVSSGFPAMDPAIFKTLQGSRYRVAIDDAVLSPHILRNYGLRTPQGWDPFLTSEYKRLAEQFGHFSTNWLFEIDPSNETALKVFGVKYYITAEQGGLWPKLNGNKRFRLLQPADAYFKVFEFVDPRTPYGWEGEAGGQTSLDRWEPERRAFSVRADGAGRFYLAEQWAAGWSARLDGKRVPVERWHGALQAVNLPGGTHRLEFRYFSSSLLAGAVVSTISLVLLVLSVVLLRRRERQGIESPQSETIQERTAG